MATSVIKAPPKRILSNEVSGTTNNVGIIDLTTNGKPILFAICNVGASICLLGSSNPTQWVKIVDYTLTPITNTSVTVWYYYYDA